jgi:hypothetical protein
MERMGVHFVAQTSSAQTLKGKAPAIPEQFEQFEASMQRMSELYTKLWPKSHATAYIRKLLKDIQENDGKIRRSPDWMHTRAPSIIWQLVQLTEKMFDVELTPSDFTEAEENGEKPGFYELGADIDSIPMLINTTIGACPDMPPSFHRPTNAGGGRPQVDRQQEDRGRGRDRSRNRQRDVLNPAPQGNPAPTGPAAGSFQPRLNGNHHRNFVSMWLTVPIHKRNLPLTSVCHKAGTTVQAVLEAANLPPTECANYFIKGQCRYAGCRNTHTDRALPQENADRALALIRPDMPLL